MPGKKYMIYDAGNYTGRAACPLYFDVSGKMTTTEPKAILESAKRTRTCGFCCNESQLLPHGLPACKSGQVFGTQRSGLLPRVNSEVCTSLAEIRLVNFIKSVGAILRACTSIGPIIPVPSRDLESRCSNGRSSLVPRPGKRQLP